MKKYIFLMLTFVLFQQAVNAQDHQKSAKELLNIAETDALRENKNVFIVYHASWCTWCKKMLKLIESPEFLPIFEESYVILTIDVLESKNKELETPGGNELLEQMGGYKAGLPFWSIVDSNGDLLQNSMMPDGINVGCPSSREEIDYFLEVLKSTSKMDDTQLVEIGQAFENI